MRPTMFAYIMGVGGEPIRYRNYPVIVTDFWWLGKSKLEIMEEHFEVLEASIIESPRDFEIDYNCEHN